MSDFPGRNIRMPEEFWKLFCQLSNLKIWAPCKHFREDPLNFSILCENENTVVFSEMEVVRIAFAALRLWFPQTKSPEESSAGYCSLKGCNQQNLNITAGSQMQLNSQFRSVAQLCPTLCDPMNCSTPGFPVHHQLPELLKLTSFELVMPFNHLILCRPLLPLPSIFPSIRAFSNESVLPIR